MRRTELIMARRQINALIQSDPTQIVLTRTTMVADGAGGFKKGPQVVLDPQTITIVPFKRRMSEMLINTELGDVVEYPYIVLGYPTLDIQREDTFTWNGDSFSVHAVDIKQDVRVSAAVDYTGGRTNG